NVGSYDTLGLDLAQWFVVVSRHGYPPGWIYPTWVVGQCSPGFQLGYISNRRVFRFCDGFPCVGLYVFGDHCVIVHDMFEGFCVLFIFPCADWALVVAICMWVKDSLAMIGR